MFAIRSYPVDIKDKKSATLSKIHFVMCDMMYLLPKATQLTKYMTYNFEVKSMEVSR